MTEKRVKYMLQSLSIVCIRMIFDNDKQHSLTEITDLLPTVTLYHYLHFYSSKLDAFVMFPRVIINTQRLKRISTCINLF